MNQKDPAHERLSSLRRSQLARRGLVAGAVAGSLGIAGALGLSAAMNPPASSNTATSPTKSSRSGDDGGGSENWTFRGQDDAGQGAGESDDGQWVPVPPSPRFSSGSHNGTGGSQGGTSSGGGGGGASGGSGSSGGGGGGGGGGFVVQPHASTGGS